MRVLMCVCARVMSLREKRVFATVSALATCLGLMRLVASHSDWLPAPAFVLFYSLHGRMRAQVRSAHGSGQQFVIIRILKWSKNTRRNGRPYKLAVMVKGICKADLSSPRPSCSGC